MRQKRSVLHPIALIISSLLLGSSIALGDEPRYRIGVIVPLTGPISSFGAFIRQSIERVRTPGVEWVFEDDGCDSAKTISAYRKLSDVDEISFVIGPVCASPQQALAPLLSKRERIALLPISAPESVFASSGSNMFSVQYSAEAEASFLAEEMNRRGLRRAAILSVDNEYSRSMEAGFLRNFRGEVARSFHAPSFDPQYMKAAALKLKATSFDSIFLADISPLLLGLLSELKKLGVAKRPVFANQGAQLPDVIAAEGENSHGVMYAYPNVPDSDGAGGYFPKLAAKLMSQAVVSCGGKYSCVLNSLRDSVEITKAREPKGEIILKTIVKD